MIISHKDIINLPVETRSGQKLGLVSGFEIDGEKQCVIKYYVKSEKIISHLLAKELIIAAEQVVNLTADKMTVEDNVVKSKKMVEDTAASVTT